LARPDLCGDGDRGDVGGVFQVGAFVAQEIGQRDDGQRYREERDRHRGDEHGHSGDTTAQPLSRPLLGRKGTS
jgi:hypothetical protein